MFPTTCITTSLSEPARAGDRHTMPARSPSVGDIHLRAIGLLGTMFATLGVSSEGYLGPNPYHLLLKLQIYCQIKSPFHFYGTSGLLPLINLFLSHLLTPTTRTLPPCRQHHSTQLITKILLMSLTVPDNPLLCHYFYYSMTMKCLPWETP